MNDKYEKISTYFTLGEATFLPKWLTYHIPSEEELNNIKIFAKKMDLVREFLGDAIQVHVWIRPILNNPNSSDHGKDYNLECKGAPKSYHKLGRACDFHINSMTCDEVRAKLLPKLEEFGLRMENNQGSNWVHLDDGKVVSSRFFKP